MIRYMLDTNIVIYVLKNKPEKVRMAFKAHRNQMCISSVTVMELYYEAYMAPDNAFAIIQIEQFMAQLVVKNYDTKAASFTGNLRAHSKLNGKKDNSYDSMIAGHAQSLGLTIVTNNDKDFKNYGVDTENWA